MNEQILDAWAIHSRIVLYLLDAVEPEGLKGIPIGMKGRAVGEIFAHIHNVRLTWLEVSAPALLSDLSKIPLKSKADKEAVTKGGLYSALQGSAQALHSLLKQGIETGKIKDARPHVMGFYSYMVAHEWYHISEIAMTLTQSGHRLPDSVLYGLWEWDRR